MERMYIDAQTYTYTGSEWDDPSTPNPYIVEDDFPVTGFEFDIRMKNGRGTVEISIDGYEDSVFNIRSLNREPFEGYFYVRSGDEFIELKKYDRQLLEYRGWNVHWQDFQFIATPRGKTEIYPYGFGFLGDLGDYGDNYDDPRYQSSYYFASVGPLRGPVPIPVPASLPMMLIALWAINSVRIRKEGCAIT